jgi:hypothetical protein
MSRPPLKKKIGNRVRLQIYISEEMYLALKELADPYDERWESNLSRRALGEFVERNSSSEPKEGERRDRITSSAKSKHEQRSRPAQER